MCNIACSIACAFNLLWSKAIFCMFLQGWVSARSANDFSKFAPLLKEWIELTKKRSQYIDSSRPAYDVALQDYEKGMTSARLDQIFSQVSLLG